MLFHSKVCFMCVISLMLVVKAAPLDDEASTTSILVVTLPKLLKVKVYYETLCGDSLRFIRSPLKYAMVDMDWLQYTDLQFVPYGKASVWKSENITTLYCQHGNRECELNALHACIIENNNAEEQFKMITCLMNGYRTDIDRCAKNLQIDVTAAKLCKETRSNADILKKYGDDTDSIGLSFVPSIAFDGEFNPWEQSNILYYFGDTFCKKYKAKYDIKLKNCP